MSEGSTNKILNELYSIDNYYEKLRNAQDISKLSQAMDIITDITKQLRSLFGISVY